MSVNELLDEGVDYLLVKYQYAQKRWADLQEYVEAF